MADAPIRIQVTRRFDASPERLFDAWLDLEMVKRFMFSPETGTLLRAEMDPRVGGRYVLTDRRADGDVQHEGEYLLIDRPRRLVFTFGIPAFSPDLDVITIEIVPEGSGALLTLTAEMKPEWAQYAERTQLGWATIVERLAVALA